MYNKPGQTFSTSSVKKKLFFPNYKNSLRKQVAKNVKRYFGIEGKSP